MYVNKPVEVVRYPRIYDFAGLVRRHLNVYDLSRLHELVQTEGIFKRENDQSTWAHRRFYEIGPEFFALYRTFVRSFVEPFVGSKLVYQKIPTFRVHLPGNVAVGEFHKDSKYHHNAAAINFWLPLTYAEGTSSVWIEQVGELSAPTLSVGEVLVFDGVGLLHGNKPNETGKTRVSFDFRVVPEGEFVPSDEVSVNTGVRMDIGGYYEQ